MRPRFRRWLYLSLSLLFLSGSLHFVLHQWFPLQGDFGPAPNPAEPWLMKLHGAVMMLVLLQVGSLWPTHIRPMLRARRNLRAGLAVLLAAAVLLLSGWGLYYASGDSLRTLIRWLHIGFGLAIAVAFVMHLRGGRRSSTYNQHSRHARHRAARAAARHPH